MLRGPQRIFDVAECRDDRRAVDRQQFHFLGDRLVALRTQPAVVEDRLQQTAAKGERRSDAGDGENRSRQRRILHSGARGQTEAWQHCGPGNRHVRMCGLEVGLGQPQIRTPGQQFGRQAGPQQRLVQCIERGAIDVELFGKAAEQQR